MTARCVPSRTACSGSALRGSTSPISTTSTPNGQATRSSRAIARRWTARIGRSTACAGGAAGARGRRQRHRHPHAFR
jgi:hypothetical protein